MTSTKKINGRVVAVSVSDRKGVKKANVDLNGRTCPRSRYSGRKTKSRLPVGTIATFWQWSVMPGWAGVCRDTRPTIARDLQNLLWPISG